LHVVDEKLAAALDAFSTHVENGTFIVREKGA
jgi:hypothetical protein